MSAHRILTKDFKQAERVARDLPPSTEKEIAEIAREGKQKELSYGEIVGQRAAGWGERKSPQC